MKKFSHDYTKVAAAESHLYAAQQINAHDDPIEAWKRIEDARRLLQEYLARDNMVEDDDVEDGWVKACDTFTDEEVDFIRDLFGEQLQKCPSSPTSTEELDIINRCQSILGCPEFDSLKSFTDNSSSFWTEINDK